MDWEFTREHALEHSTILRLLPFDRPLPDLQKCQEIAIPTLVIGNRLDPVHPWEFAERLKLGIPTASLVEVPSKSINLNEHKRAARDSIAQFLQQHSKKDDNLQLGLVKLETIVYHFFQDKFFGFRYTPRIVITR
jgi:pimeloyl-ACP methyl ester carboxylesterase